MSKYFDNDVTIVFAATWTRPSAWWPSTGSTPTRTSATSPSTASTRSARTSRTTVASKHRIKLTVSTSYDKPVQSSYLCYFCRVVAVSPGPGGASAARPRLQPRADVLDQRRERVVRQAQARGPPHERAARHPHPRQLQDTGQRHWHFTITTACCLWKKLSLMCVFQGAFSNLEDFAKDFKCKVGSQMNPQTDQKCKVW